MIPVVPSGSRNAESGIARALRMPLRGELIARHAADVDVEVVQETGSTNADLVQRARRWRPQTPVLRATLAQTAGRGRLGRRWHASRGAALLFSLAVPLAMRDARIAAATLACGIGAAESLRDAGAPVLLKWPNDLLLGARKLGGILCELVLDPDGGATLVVGLGVNLLLDASMRDSIGQPAAALAEVLDPAALMRREPLIAALAVRILAVLQDFESAGFVPLQSRFMMLFAQRDQEVELIDHDVRVATGRALGVDGEGRLLLATEQGLRAFSSGELSLRAVR